MQILAGIDDRAALDQQIAALADNAAPISCAARNRAALAERAEGYSKPAGAIQSTIEETGGGLQHKNPQFD